MTLGLFRGLLTAALFISFIALWVWAWSRQRTTDFQAAAMLPLADDRAGSSRSERS